MHVLASNLWFYSEFIIYLGKKDDKKETEYEHVYICMHSLFQSTDSHEYESHNLDRVSEES